MPFLEKVSRYVEATGEGCINLNKKLISFYLLLSRWPSSLCGEEKRGEGVRCILVHTRTRWEWKGSWYLGEGNWGWGGYEMG